MRRLLKLHGVKQDLQAAIVASPLASLRMFVEYFENKEAVKAESPDIFSYSGSSPFSKKLYGTQLALVWSDAVELSRSKPPRLSENAVALSAASSMDHELRQSLCRAYAKLVGSGKQPSVRDQGGDYILGIMYHDF